MRGGDLSVEGWGWGWMRLYVSPLDVCFVVDFGWLLMVSVEVGVRVGMGRVEVGEDGLGDVLF